MSSDPADAFAIVWDTWSQIAHPGQVDGMAARLGDHPDQLADEIRQAGEVVRLPDEGDLEQALALLIALDQVLGECIPINGPHYGPFAGIAARHTRTGKLNSDAVPGAVLPRWACPNRPGLVTERLDDLPRNVIRVPGDLWSHCAVVRPPRLDDIARSPSDEPLKVAMTPMMATVNDLSLDAGIGMPGNPAASWYVLRPAWAELAPRVPRLLDALDESDADIALLPEGCLSPELLDVWQAEIANKPPPRLSRLRWIMVGSGPLESEDPRADCVANAAVILSRATGEVLLRHDKFAPFNFGEGDTAAWGLEGQLDLPAPIHERIWTGDRANALESMAGRVAVLICEDVNRHGQAPADAAASLGPSLVLVPVFAPGMKPYYWEHQAGRRWRTLFGASVAISNSLVVAGLVEPLSTPWRYGMVVPRHQDEAAWPPEHVQDAFGSSPEAVFVASVDA